MKVPATPANGINLDGLVSCDTVKYTTGTAATADANTAKFTPLSVTSGNANGGWKVTCVATNTNWKAWSAKFNTAGTYAYRVEDGSAASKDHTYVPAGALTGAYTATCN